MKISSENRAVLWNPLLVSISSGNGNSPSPNIADTHQATINTQTLAHPHETQANMQWGMHSKWLYFCTPIDNGTIGHAFCSCIMHWKTDVFIIDLSEWQHSRCKQAESFNSVYSPILDLFNYNYFLHTGAAIGRIRKQLQFKVPAE